MSDRVLILGASSAIAKGITAELAVRGCSLFLAGRNEEELQRLASDLRLRHHVDVQIGRFDAEKFDEHEAFFNNVIRRTGQLKGIVVAFGEHGDLDRSRTHFSEAQHIINANFLGACSILTYGADYLEKQKNGFIVALSSVAGERGRQSNYVYGCSKGALTLYLQGLRNRLYPSGVQVLTVLLGRIDTSMTFGRYGNFLMGDPDAAGKSIVKSLLKGRNVIYFPFTWRFVMMIVKAIPECIFKRLKT